MNQKDISDPVKFYSNNGLISCIEKTQNENYLILGTENLGK